MAELKKGDKKLLHAWAFYDWANSVYSLVISSAVFPIFYGALTIVKDSETGEKISDTVTFLGYDFNNDSLISYVTAFSFLIVSILSPILSGVSYYVGNKERFMKFFCYLGAISCMLLYSFDLDNFDLGIIYYFFAVVGFWGSLVFYNSYLPDIANIDQQDITSAKGYSLGYLGSIILLIFCLIMMQFPDILNLNSQEQAVKISFVLVGVWWLVFSQYSFHYLPGRKQYNIEKSNLYSVKTFTSGFNQLLDVVNQLKVNKKLKIFLFSFFILSFINSSV